MGYMDESRWNTRQTDDETQKYLVSFFNEISKEPGFEDLYQSLNIDEREKLQKMNNIVSVNDVNSTNGLAPSQDPIQ